MSFFPQNHAKIAMWALMGATCSFDASLCTYSELHITPGESPPRTPYNGECRPAVPAPKERWHDCEGTANPTSPECAASTVVHASFFFLRHRVGRTHTPQVYILYTPNRVYRAQPKKTHSARARAGPVACGGHSLCAQTRTQTDPDRICAWRQITESCPGAWAGP